MHIWHLCVYTNIYVYTKVLHLSSFHPLFNQHFIEINTVVETFDIHKASWEPKEGACGVRKQLTQISQGTGGVLRTHLIMQSNTNIFSVSKMP